MLKSTFSYNSNILWYVITDRLVYVGWGQAKYTCAYIQSFNSLQDYKKL